MNIYATQKAAGITPAAFYLFSIFMVLSHYQQSYLIIRIGVCFLPIVCFRYVHYLYSWTAIGNGIVVFFICEPLFFHDFPPVMNA